MPDSLNAIGGLHMKDEPVRIDFFALCVFDLVTPSLLEVFYCVLGLVGREQRMVVALIACLMTPRGRRTPFLYLWFANFGFGLIHTASGLATSAFGNFGFGLIHRF